MTGAERASQAPVDATIREWELLFRGEYADWYDQGPCECCGTRITLHERIDGGPRLDVEDLNVDRDQVRALLVRLRSMPVHSRWVEIVPDRFWTVGDVTHTPERCHAARSAGDQ